MRYKKNTPIILGIILGFVSIWLGTYDKLWKGLSIPESYYIYGQLSVALSIFFLMLGFFISFSIEQGEQSRNYTKIKEILSGKNYFEELIGDDALRDLSRSLNEAVSVLNTKIYPKEVEPDSTIESMSDWHRIVDKSIKKGVQFTEILSPCWKQYALERSASFSKLKKKLEVFILSNSDIPLINFTIITTKSEKTIWFGWIVPDYTGFSNPCYKSKDLRIINLFESWFNSLTNVSKKI